MSQEYHEMILEKTHLSGIEEWACPVCGRRFLMQWPPEYKKVVLEEGDEYAIHSGGRNNQNPEPASTTEETQALDFGLTEEEQEHLDPWVEWMDLVNFEKRWSDEP